MLQLGDAAPLDPGLGEAADIENAKVEIIDLSIQYPYMMMPWNGYKSLKRRSIRRFVITEKAPTRAFSWLKAPTSAFTFKTFKQTLTPQ